MRGCRKGNEVEVVVKLLGCPEIESFKFLCEAFAALLAQDLDLPVLQPYRVEITEAFAQTVVDPDYQPIVASSIGWNFGSAKWAPGTTIWPKDKKPSKAMLSTAAEIFAFDAIIQNPDRKSSNPNCAFLANDFVIFDHESAFSQFLAILPSNPWDSNALTFLSDHLFRNALKGGGLELNRLQGALEAITEKRLKTYGETIPEVWSGGAVTAEKIRDYLLECVEKFNTIKTQLEALL